MSGPLRRVSRTPTGVVARALAAAAVLLAMPSPAQSPGEYQIKAAFLFNFAKFVEWPAQPADSASPLLIGIVGADPFGRDLEQTIEGKTVRGRALAIRRFPVGGEVGPCHILFVGLSDLAERSEVLRSLRGTPTLTVGEDDGFLRAGGMINFVLEENRIRFQINPEPAERERLQISSQLLKLATVVRLPGERGER